MHIQARKVHIDGVSVAELANEYGTPLYVYSAQRIHENYGRVRGALAAAYPDSFIHYAIKACNTLRIAKLLVDLGAGVDAASPNEIRLAQLLGVPPSRTTFTGNNLSDADLAFAFESKVVINLDDDSYLDRLLRIGTPSVLSFRINPGFMPGAYTSMQIGSFTGPQAKFGVPHDRVSNAYGKAKRAGIHRVGAHMMPHSNVLDVPRFQDATARFLDILLPAIVEHDLELEFIDIGGGLGIPYNDDEPPLDVFQVAKDVAEVIRERVAHFGVKRPTLILEPARYFVGDAGFLIGRVHGIKESDVRSIVGTDISMNILARPALYGAQHRVYVDGRYGDDTTAVGFCGQVCENTDMWRRTVDLSSSVEVGDLVVIRDVGAYGFGMSYEYNGRLRPAEVLIRDGKHELVRRRETFEDMIRTMTWDRSDHLTTAVEE